MKYFVIFNLCGFYSDIKKKLRQLGFKKDNDDHIIVVFGNAFGRGPENVKTYKFLRSLPKNKKILFLGKNEFNLLNFEYNDSTENKIIINQFIDYKYPGIKKYVNNTFVIFDNIGIRKWIQSEEWKKINNTFINCGPAQDVFIYEDLKGVQGNLVIE